MGNISKSCLALNEYILVSIPLYMSFMLGLVESPGPKTADVVFCRDCVIHGGSPGLLHTALFLATLSPGLLTEGEGGGEEGQPILLC